MFNKDSIGVRVLAAITLLVIVIACVFFVLYSKHSYDSFIQSEVKAARNIIMMAESVRENMADKWEKGLFSPQTLLDIQATESDPEVRKAKLLATVPVVTAWESAKAKAAEGGFEFRTPRHNARNKDNEPDSVEQAALEHLNANSQLDEYYVIDEEMNAIRYFRPVKLGEVCMYCHGDPAQSRTVWGRDDGKDITGFKIDGKKVGDMHGAFEIIKSLDEADASLASSLTASVILVLFLLTVTIIVLHWLIRRLVTRPVNGAVDDITAAARSGDLTFRLEANGKSEIAVLARGLNGFLDRIHGLVSEVSSSAEQLTSSAVQMAAVTEQTTKGMYQQQAETEQVATAMNEMVSTVEEVSRHAVSAADAAHVADNEAGKGKQVVQQVIESIDGLAAEVERASGVIHKLEGDSENIGAVVDVIKGIAEQTNLLALNAAIEAARAGEQGRGFAVVADEVRTLASRTQQSTAEIQQMIEQLQSGAADAVQVMELGRGQANRSVESAAEAGSSLESIARAVTAINDMNAQIATAAEEQTAVADEINRNVTTISTVAHETTEGARQVADASRNLEDLAERMRSQLAQFKI